MFQGCKQIEIIRLVDRLIKKLNFLECQKGSWGTPLLLPSS